MQETTPEDINDPLSQVNLHIVDTNDFIDLYIGREAGKKMYDKICNAKKSIKIISPYLSIDTVNKIKDKCLEGITVSLISIFSEKQANKEHIVALNALIHKPDQYNHEYRILLNSTFIMLPSIHEKLYIIDDNIVYSGSLNFTLSGIFNNHETIVSVKHPDVVQKFVAYFNRLYNAKSLKRWDASALGKKLDDLENLKKSTNVNDDSEKSIIITETETKKRIFVTDFFYDKYNALKNSLNRKNRVELSIYNENEFFDCFIKPYAGEDILIPAINKAKKTIKIVSPYLSTYQLAKLYFRQSDGIDINLITVCSEDQLKYEHSSVMKNLFIKKDNMCMLLFKNTIFFRETSLHEKIYIIDDETVILGSLNFTKKGMTENYETAFIIKRLDDVQNFVEYFTKLSSLKTYQKWDVDALSKRIYPHLGENCILTRCSKWVHRRLKF
jgi:phosphatidylserine/phosphatidylglycerophosphate/cardiolipin synthase-like enzyme